MLAGSDPRHDVVRLLRRPLWRADSRPPPHPPPQGHRSSSYKQFTQSALHIAAHRGHYRVVEYLIKRGGSGQVEATNGFGDKPLHTASQGGGALCLRTLLDAGADIDSRGQFDWTALHFASWEGSAECVRLLLERGASKDLKNKARGASPHACVAR